MLPGTRVLPTHEVDNQPAPALPPDPWRTDEALRGYALAFGGRTETLLEAGERFCDPALHDAAAEARRDPPRLATFGPDGTRRDEVRFNGGYHAVMRAGLESGYVSSASDGAAGGHVTHAALVYMLTQVEPAICCPLTMTYAAVPALRADPSLDAVWRPRLTAALHDPSPLPVDRRPAATRGMAMTEKQGGSDVRAGRTRAEPGEKDYRLTGHKWFCSAPMSDGFLTLAQAPGGLTCFLMPRWLPDRRNAIRPMRLKDKLGNRANASAEIEMEGALAHRLGEEGDGIRTILEMVHHTRLDTALAPAGLMRAALAEAVRWCEGRVAFERRLIDQPLMRVVLADLALDWEAALAVGLRVAAAFDRPEERPFARIAVALAKFHANKAARRARACGGHDPHVRRGGTTRSTSAGRMKGAYMLCRSARVSRLGSRAVDVTSIARTVSSGTFDQHGGATQCFDTPSSPGSSSCRPMPRTGTICRSRSRRAKVT